MVPNNAQAVPRQAGRRSSFWMPGPDTGRSASDPKTNRCLRARIWAHFPAQNADQDRLNPQRLRCFLVRVCGPEHGPEICA